MAERTGPHSLRELGDLFFYSIPEALEIPVDRLRESARQAGLPSPWLPNPVTPLCAFKRAAQLLGAQRASLVLGAASDEKLIQTTVYVRDAPRKHCLRHIVKEIRRGSDKPEYLILGSVEFADGLHFTLTTTDPVLVRDFDAMRQALLKRYQSCLASFVNKDLQRLVMRALRDLHALPMRSSGGVFFIPLSQRGQLRNLARCLEELGAECDCFVVLNAAREAERLARKLQLTIANELAIIESRLHEMRLQGYLPACRIRGFHSTLAWCRDVSKTYETLLATDVSPAKATLRQAQELVEAIVVV